MRIGWGSRSSDYRNSEEVLRQEKFSDSGWWGQSSMVEWIRVYDTTDEWRGGVDETAITTVVINWAWRLIQESSEEICSTEKEKCYRQRWRLWAELSSITISVWAISSGPLTNVVWGLVKQSHTTESWSVKENGIVLRIIDHLHNLRR